MSSTTSSNNVCNFDYIDIDENKFNVSYDSTNYTMPNFDSEIKKLTLNLTESGQTESIESEFYKLFTMGSNSEISKDPALAKAAGGKTGKYKGKRLRDSNIKPDENYMDRRSEVFEKANFAKYSQNPELKEMLLATNNAKLVHKIQRSKDVEVFTETMRVRERLRKNE